MPGNQQLHLRVPQDKHERYKETAKAKKMSLTTFVLTVLDHAADKVLDGDTELVGTTARPAQQEVQAELRPAKGVSYGPDKPIGEMTSEQIRRYLAELLADEAEQEQRRLEREQFTNWD